MQMEEGAVRRRSLLFSPTNRKPLSDCSNTCSNINAALSSSSNAFNKCKSRNSISRRTPTPSLPLPVPAVRKNLLTADVVNGILHHLHVCNGCMSPAGWMIWTRRSKRVKAQSKCVCGLSFDPFAFVGPNHPRHPTDDIPYLHRGSVELDVSMPVSAFCSERHTLDERKNKKKAVSNVVSGRQIPKTSDSWNKSDGVESLDMLKAKPLTVPCRKKQRAVSCEKRISKEAQLQDFIKKQNTYFKEIDEFILSEEEVESVDELD